MLPKQIHNQARPLSQLHIDKMTGRKDAWRSQKFLLRPGDPSGSNTQLALIGGSEQEIVNSGCQYGLKYPRGKYKRRLK